MKQHIGDIMPQPVATRHDSWIRTAVWVRTHTQKIREWLAEEAKGYPSAGTRAALEWVRGQASAIYLQAVFVDQFSNHLVKVYHKLEAQTMPTPGDEDRQPRCRVLEAYDSLRKLEAALTTASTATAFGGRVEAALHRKRSDDSPFYDVEECRTEFRSALKAMVDKLNKYLDGHAAFLVEAQALHPKNTDSIRPTVASYCKLFSLNELAQLRSTGNGEWLLYRSMCPAVPWEEDGYSLFRWWSARRVDLPILAPSAVAALVTPMHNMEIERVYSQLGMLLTPQRMGLSEENKWSHV